MQEKLKPQFPSQGWKEILTARQQMLDKYDRARTQASSHRVETFHGNVAEAAWREWMAEFLPKRYGVTSGFVVSPGLSSRDRLPHFDVIIYDQIESPILWVEDSPDVSTGGKSRAIPVEHVRAILEVKASFTGKTVRDSLRHLRELSPMLKSVDAVDERYKLHLPAAFRCGAVFFELREKDAHTTTALSAVMGGLGVRGYFGGVILRGEGRTLADTGRIMLLNSKTPIKVSCGRERASLLQGVTNMGTSVQKADDIHITPMLMWLEIGFAQFAFDLIAMMQGTYDPARVSSFYGLGVTYVETTMDPAAPKRPCGKRRAD